MKVICIDASKGVNSGEIPMFKEGDLLTATQSKNYPLSYHISEHPFNSSDGSVQSWRKSRFIPLSSIDETEMIKEREMVVL